MSEPRTTAGPENELDVSRLLRLAGPRPDPPADVTARVHAAALDAWRGQVKTRRWRRRAWLAAAAAIVAAMAIVLGRPAPRVPPPLEPAPAVMVLERAVGGGVRRVAAGSPAGLVKGDGLPAGAWIETTRDGRAAWRMGGASVRLDRDTRIQVRAPSRLWLERGALYVDGGDGVAPIEVETATGRVVERGTQFEVRGSAGRLAVRVREGSVLLWQGRDRHQADAGSALVADGGSVVRRPVAVHGADWSWMEEIAPEFALDGRTLQELVAWTARETGRHIRFARPEDARRASRTTLHGSSAGLAPSETLATVLPTCGLAWRSRGRTVWIEPAGAP